MATSAALYLRISDDQDGEQQATVRQRADCIAFCERNGWEVAGIFEDVDYSGFSGKRRPGFEAMLDAIADGTVNTVVAWKVDRFHRNLRDFVRLDEACSAAGATIRTVADGVDTSTPAGQMVATMLVAQGRMESANTSTRVKRAMAQHAAEGKPKLSRSRAYGYDRAMQTIIPHEADVIREVVQRVLQHEPVHAITCDLNRRGLVTSEGHAWRIRNLTRMITSAYVSGQREYNGQLSPGIWPAIIQPDELRRVRAVTSARVKRGRPPVSPLAGLVRCATCGGSLSHWSRAGQSRRYRCTAIPGAPNCGRISINAEALEGAVRDAVLLVMEGVELPTIQNDNGATDAVVNAEAKMAELAHDYYVAKIIGKAEFLAVRGELDAELKAARVALARVPAHHRTFTRLTAEEWDAADVDTRRAVAAQVLEHVAVGPAPKRGRVPFDTSRLAWAWRY